jgi:tetratricopeptide (TPR) repeat protein
MRAWSLYDLGLLLHDTDKAPEAAAMFREAGQLFAENAAKPGAAREHIHALAWFLADCPDTSFRDARRAVELAQSVVQADPQSARFWACLGVAQARAGQWQDADESLRKSMQLGSEGDSHLWFILAQTQWQLGNKEAARKWYDQAIAWMDENQPRNEELRRFRAEAESLLEIKKE